MSNNLEFTFGKRDLNLTLTLTPLPGFPLVSAGDDLAEVILNGIGLAGLILADGDIIVLAQKIVSKAEDRKVHLSTIIPSQKAQQVAREVDKDPRLVELILQESNTILRSKPGTIIVEHHLGFVCANAGIDHSNVSGDDPEREDWVLLLPENPDASADGLRMRLEEIAKVNLGVLIIDSHGRAWRMGTTGVAIGLSGIPGLVDLRGEQDLFGYTLRITQVGAADELAAAASLVMGQAAEGTPVIHARGFPYDLREGAFGEILRPKEQDLFR
jgi:coenzyme F420-0:L-glutamate ligase/coenzyme F420-1:gamma-L-glutamate ligase